MVPKRYDHQFGPEWPWCLGDFSTAYRTQKQIKLWSLSTLAVVNKGILFRIRDLGKLFVGQLSRTLHTDILCKFETARRLYGGSATEHLVHSRSSTCIFQTQAPVYRRWGLEQANTDIRSVGQFRTMPSPNPTYAHGSQKTPSKYVVQHMGGMTP